MKTKVVQPQDKKKEVSVEVLAESIRDLAIGFRQMRSSGLTKRAILTLLHDASKVSKTEIGKILDAMDNLERFYLKS